MILVRSCTVDRVKFGSCPSNEPPHAMALITGKGQKSFVLKPENENLNKKRLQPDLSSGATFVVKLFASNYVYIHCYSVRLRTPHTLVATYV